MSYVFMKVLESAPERYDRGMRLLMLGRLTRVHGDIAERLNDGDQVLDLGCGTGALVAKLAHRGICVTGIDISPPMLSLACQRVCEEGLEDQVELQEMGAVDLDTAFTDGCFDVVVSSLVFSELSDDEISYTLAECHRILRSGGQLLIADEIMPDSTLGRVGSFLFRLPFAVAAFVLTQNTTHRVAGLERRIERAGFRIVDTRRYLADTLQLIIAEKVGPNA
jgi:demethylmenaquinone methyltransferase/2-methoxy-6-polyprenyl-1,4-benzoquinol methylase